MAATPIDYERIIQEVYEAVLRVGDTAVDIGAHLGRHTLPMARCVGPTGHVVAIEPLPVCREELLRRLVSDCPNLRFAVQILPLALSDRAGAGSLIVAEDLLAHSGLRQTTYPVPTRVSSVPVQLETLDELFATRSTLHYLKVDAEGAELEILRGGMGCLERLRPVISFEFGMDCGRAFGVAPADLARFWTEQKYRIYAITGQHLGESDFVRRAVAGDIWDYVAVPAEKADLNRLVARVLNRPRVNWLAVRAQLNHAEDHAEVGAVTPPLQRFRGPLWPVARGVARLFLLAAQIITVPQRLFNRALLLGLEQLTTDLEATERERQRQERQLHDLQRRLELLERELLRLHDAQHESCDYAVNCVLPKG